jgi:hypothetical protein
MSDIGAVVLIFVVVAVALTTIKREMTTPTSDGGFGGMG